MSIPDTLKTRLNKDRPMTSITLRIPVDVVESMKTIAPQRGLAGHQTLLKAYLSDGLRRDEAQFSNTAQAQLNEVTNETVTLHLDADVLEVLRATGDGWQTCINDTLRSSLRLSGRIL